MAAKIINLVVEQNADFRATVTISNDNGTKLNLTNYTAACSIKKSPLSSAPTGAMTVSFVDRVNGKIMLSMDFLTTAALPGGRHVYDVIITSPTNFVTRVIQGSLLVSPGVT